MKPRNFPGRKTLRRIRAGVEADAGFTARYQHNIRVRIGASKRDARGLAK